MNYLLSVLSRFPSLLRSLVKAVLEDEDRGGLDRGEMSAVLEGNQQDIDLASPGDNNGEGNGRKYVFHLMFLLSEQTHYYISDSECISRFMNRS